MVDRIEAVVARVGRGRADGEIGLVRKREHVE